MFKNIAFINIKNPTGVESVKFRISGQQWLFCCYKNTTAVNQRYIPNTIFAIWPVYPTPLSLPKYHNYDSFKNIMSLCILPS